MTHKFDYLIIMPKSISPYAPDEKPICIRDTRRGKLQFVNMRGAQDFLMSSVLKGYYVNLMTDNENEVIQIAKHETMKKIADEMKMRDNAAE